MKVLRANNNHLQFCLFVFWFGVNWTPFCYTLWCGEQSLKKYFHDLYFLCYSADTLALLYPHSVDGAYIVVRYFDCHLVSTSCSMGLCHFSQWIDWLTLVWGHMLLLSIIDFMQEWKYIHGHMLYYRSYSNSNVYTDSIISKAHSKKDNSHSSKKGGKKKKQLQIPISFV